MDVFDLCAKISLDKSEYESGLNDAKGSMSNLAKGIGNGLKTVAKVGAAAIAAGAAGVAALTKMGVEGYAQYEQLVGGVDTLFKTANKTVMAYAENAYKSAGMSSNAYMETITSFSASLIQSLGGDTAKAAEVGNMAITDMSDNANKMGTSMEMIQNAYNGFAKQNYTMLDNLKLGYGGTKEEMQRLLKDAQKISGIKYDISSFADVTEAIHVMQVEMGIAGTTAKEAASTIEGSLGMMKGAWQNLVVGMADENANLDALMDDFVESTITAAGNIMPRIEQTLEGVGQLIDGLAPVIAERLPGLIESILPSIVSAASTLFVKLALKLPELASVLLAQIPVIVQSIRTELENTFPELETPFKIIEELFNGVWEAAQIVWDGIGKPIFDAVSSAFSATKEAITPLIDALGSYITEGGFAADVTGAVEVAVVFLRNAYSAVTGFIEDVIQGFKDAVEWGKEHETILTLIGVAIGTVTAAIVAYNIAAAIKNAGGIAEIAQLGILQVQLWGLEAAEIASTAAKWLATTATTAYTAATTALGAAMTFLTSPITLVVLAIGALIAIVVLCVKHWDDIKAAGAAAWEWICNAWKTAGEWFNTNVIQPVAQFFSDLWNAIKEAAVSAWNGIKNAFSVAASWFNNTIIMPVKNFFTGMWDGLKNGAKNAWEGIKSVFSKVTNWFKDVFSKAWQAVKNVFSAGGKVFDGIKDGIVNVFKTVVNAIIGGINKVISVPFNAINAILRKIKNIEIVGIKPFNWVHEFNVPQIPKLSTGLHYVPYDEFPAFLHRGEAVLTAAQARAWRNGGGTALGGDNGQIVSVLIAILNAVTGGNEELIEAVLADKKFVVGEREFARAVKTYA